jgi:hypothetical protein
MTNEKLLKRAVTLLESVMSQGDQPDELQIEILAFLTKNGFRAKEIRTDYSGMSKKEFVETAQVHRFGSGTSHGGYALYFDWQTSEPDSPVYFNGASHMLFASASNSTKKMIIEAGYKWIVLGEEVPYFMDSWKALKDTDRRKYPMSYAFKNYTSNTKANYKI